MHESGLTPVFVEGQPTFEEAELVLICRKRGVTDIAPERHRRQEVQDKWYGDHDYHTMYIGEIVALTRTKFCKPIFTNISPIPHRIGVYLSKCEPVCWRCYLTGISKCFARKRA